jgi:hypothetical protein
MPPTPFTDHRPEATMAKKTSCPITREQFRAHAKPVEIIINGQSMKVPVKFFQTGSLGWYLNGKIDLDVGGTSVSVQIGLNMTIIGSKELPPDPAAPAASATPSADGA